MPRRIDPYARGLEVAAAVRALVRAGGLEAVSVRAVAEKSGVATSSLRLHYRDKAFLIRCVVWDCVEHHGRRGILFRPRGDPVADVVELLATQLPMEDDAEDRDQTLLWLALVERARWCDDDTRQALQRQREEWRTMGSTAADHLGVPERAQQLEGDRLALLVEVLLARVCDGADPLDRDAAMALLRHHVRQVRWVVTTALRQAS